MKKKVYKFFRNGSYPGEVLFTCGYDIDCVLARSLKLKDTNWTVVISKYARFIKKEHFCCINQFIDEKDYYIIYFKEPFDFTDHHFATLAHEALHLCQFTLKDIMDRDEENEAEAYHLTFVIKECLRLLK